MENIFAYAFCLIACILSSAVASAEPEDESTPSRIWKLEDPPKAIRSPPLTTGGNATINSFATAVPVRKDDRIIGYKLVPKEKGVPLFAKYGLLSGDVVAKVNGISLANQKNAIRALRKLVKAPSIDLEILRNDVPIKLIIHLE